LDFAKMLSEFYAHIERLQTPALLRLLKGGNVLAKLVGGAQGTKLPADDNGGKKPFKK
jgi:hypothetical protein